MSADQKKIHYGLEGQTPGARWREAGQPDPHSTRYDCERAQLCLGHMTDDELANAVYLDPSISNLTAAKDRIRWLSRQLAAAIRSTESASTHDVSGGTK